MIATTIDQSRRLLEAGIDPQTADMWWTIIQPLKQDGWKTVPNGPPYSMLSLYKGEHIALASFEDVPAWSLSAIIHLLPERIFYRIARVRGKDVEGIFEDCVSYLSRRIEMNHDYAHCTGFDCSIREKCKRYLLHLEAVKKGMLYVSYIKPGRKGIECKFYWEEER